MLLLVLAISRRWSWWDYILKDRLALKLRHVRHAESIANDGIQLLRLQADKNAQILTWILHNEQLWEATLRAFVTLSPRAVRSAILSLITRNVLKLAQWHRFMLLILCEEIFWKVFEKKRQSSGSQLIGLPCLTPCSAETQLRSKSFSLEESVFNFLDKRLLYNTFSTWKMKKTDYCVFTCVAQRQQNSVVVPL